MPTLYDEYGNVKEVPIGRRLDRTFIEYTCGCCAVGVNNRTWWYCDRHVMVHKKKLEYVPFLTLTAAMITGLLGIALIFQGSGQEILGWILFSVMLILQVASWFAVFKLYPPRALKVSP